MDGRRLAFESDLPGADPGSEFVDNVAKPLGIFDGGDFDVFALLKFRRSSKNLFSWLVAIVDFSSVKEIVKIVNWTHNLLCTTFSNLCLHLGAVPWSAS